MSSEDEAFEALLRRVAQTPEVPLQRARVEVGSKLAGRFEVLGKLGAGGMGQVFAAFDHERQVKVALKLLGQLKPQLIAQIKQEFRAAAGLVHPNLVQLHELFSDGTEWFFTMELIEGTTLPVALAEAGEPEPSRLRGLLAQLALGLHALHQAGTLHGDLKPSNFLITDAEQRVVLLDFGLARPSRSNKRDASGTPQYMPPEQVAGRTLTEAADWYAFGVVLYEALTGRFPRPEPSRERLAGAPADLAELCLALLDPDPAARPSGNDVLQRLGAGRAAPRSAPPGDDAPPLVGRAAELERLAAAFDATLRGRPALVLLHGPSGIGKTALVERFVHSLRERGALVLAGKCRERESIGYKAADGLIDGVVNLLDELSPLEAATLLPPDLAELAVLFPALHAAAAVAQAPLRTAMSSDHALVRTRAIAAFGGLLARLRRRAPLIVWLDDLQWSDSDSALLLGPPLSGPDAVPLMLIASYRGGGGERGPTLDALLSDRTLQLPAAVEIALGELPPEAAERMALSMLPAHDPRAAQIAREIGRDAAGHPLFIGELAHALRDRAALGRSAITLVDVISDRLEALPARARQLLELVAIAGEPLPRQILRRTQALSRAGVEEAVDVLRAQRLVRSQGLKEDDPVDIHHDRIREIVVQTITDVRRRQHHLGLAQTLEAWPGSRPARQAAHYEAGGNLARAGQYWLAAADQAMRALAFAHAAELYEKGAAQAVLGRAELRAICIRRAEALALAGKGSAAADVYLQQAETGPRDEALELRRRAAEQLLLTGHLDRGLQVIEKVLDALGMGKTRGGRAALLPWLTGRALLRFTGLRHRTRSESELSREELAQLDAAWTIASSLGLVDPIRGAEFQTRHLRLALRAGEPRRVMRALTLEASYTAMSDPGASRRSAELLAVASQIAASSDDEDVRSLLAVARGVIAHLQGDAEPAMHFCKEAVARLAERGAGAVWERMTVQRLLVASLFMLGRLHELSELIPPLIATFEGTGNLCATAGFRTAYSTVAWLVRDRVDEADRQLALARAESTSTTIGYQLVHVHQLFGDSFRDLYLQEGKRAHARIVEHWPALTRALMLQVSSIRSQLWQLRASSAVAAAEQAARAGEASAARELRKDARRALGALRKDPLPRSKALAELTAAALAWSEGDEAGARATLSSCIDALDAHKLGMYAAAARVRLGAIGAARAEGERGLAALAAERAKCPDKMVELFAPGFTGSNG